MSLRWLWVSFPLNIVLIANRMGLYKCKWVPALVYSSPGMIKISFTSEEATGLLFYDYALKRCWFHFGCMRSFFFSSSAVWAVKMWTWLRTEVWILWFLWDLRFVYREEGNRFCTNNDFTNDWSEKWKHVFSTGQLPNLWVQWANCKRLSDLKEKKKISA